MVCRLKLQNNGVPAEAPKERRLVREKGLEPPRRKALDPKSSASTNFATRARYYSVV